jgi:cell wall-associated NlpC family hydrolase
MSAVQARASGKHTYTVGGQTFNLDQGGYCNRFIRQVFETVLGLKPFEWRFGAAWANLTLDKLEPYRVSGNLQPGDIIGWQKRDGYGHIALFVGDYYGDGRRLVAENTSAKRGSPVEPGTKITQLKNMKAGWKAYRLFPAIEKAGRPNE